MFTFHLTRWFFRTAADPVPCEQPRIVEPPRRCRPVSAAPAFELTVSHCEGEMVIRLKGEARFDCAGALLDGLLAPAARRQAVVTLDLSDLRSISSLAMGVLVSYRRGVVRAGGRVRLAKELQPAVREALLRAELLDLFEAASDSGRAPARPPCLTGSGTTLLPTTV
jgi:anti-anti-sigma factor